MPGGDANIQIPDITAPISELFRMLGKAAGSYWEPKQVVRMARANAEARRIEALENEGLTLELEERARKRLMALEVRKQKNIEAIAVKALDHLGEDPLTQELEEDWIVNLLEKCGNFTDDEMQNLWAKILAGEATKSGSFSKRTVNLVAKLEKEDARLFTLFGQFCWDFGNDCFQPLVYMPYMLKEFNDWGLPMQAIKHLVYLGLIDFEESGHVDFILKDSAGEIGYFGESVSLNLKADSSFVLGVACLTQAGQQLFPICSVKPNLEYFNLIKEEWLENKKAFRKQTTWKK